MKFIDYLTKHGKRVEKLRQGQLFLGWLRDHHGHSGIDPELSNCREDQRAWNLINRKYGEYLRFLT